jgi:hypothetical protein
MLKPALFVLPILAVLALPTVAAQAAAAPAGDPAAAAPAAEPQGEVTPAPALNLAALFSARACGAANAAAIGLPPRTPVITWTCGSCSDPGCADQRNGAFCGWQAGQKAYCLLQLTACTSGGYHCVCNIP